MKISKIISQNRRDFRAIFECESCGDKTEKSGYDDAYFHGTVIPDMECSKCHQKAPDNYRPLKTKHHASTTV